jgi:N6-adenosine-specific RNA methylase IME4/ParB-like chromosome segregation protein Spo0J
VGNRYQIISGHQRKRGATKAGFKNVWCWSEDMDDDAAYMALATSNNQGELSPLEIGLHALHCVALEKGGRGKKGGLSEYAAALGKRRQNVENYRDAAEVAQYENLNVDMQVLLPRAEHLAAIHSLPAPCWPACVGHVVAKGLSAADTREAAKTARDFLASWEVPKEWQAYLGQHECAAAVFCGKRPTEFAKLAKLASEVQQALSEHADLKAQWVAWVNENAGQDSWDIKKVQAKRIELDTIRLDRDHVPWVEGVQVLLADPPWQYDVTETYNRQIENHYPTATDEDICDHCHDPKLFPVLAEDCVLFLWATAPKLPEALQVMQAWGFEYKTSAVWDKKKVGMGYWFRGRHELLLVGTRGNAKPPGESLRVGSVFEEERTGHSVKPQCVYDALVAMYPKQKRFEMYQRKTRKEWPGSGNEVSAQQLDMEER